MPAMVYSATLQGVDAVTVRVEVDVSGGLPSFSTVGLAATAVRESRARVHAAIQNSGQDFPAGRVTVNLAPANLPKTGTGFDLPIALGVLAAADEELPRDRLASALVLGELSLSGRVRPIRGALAGALAARQLGVRELIVPFANGPEAALARGVTVRTVRRLEDAVEWMRGAELPQAHPTEPTTAADTPDLVDVVGQHFARRALEVAAAGGHHLLLVGGPGCGKTMLARRLPGILPALDEDEALEVTRIHSAAGLIDSTRLARVRPFRAPHHSATVAGLIGGGGPPRPGEACLAHNGVLFLDELPEFARATLETLRQPLESGEVVLSRAQGTLRFPARAQLVAAMNPCPCARRSCACTAHEVRRYRGRASGPLVDRIDLHVDVAPVPLSDITAETRGEPSETVRTRVVAARDRAAARARTVFGQPLTNASLPPAGLDAVASLSSAARLLLATAGERMALSARAVHRVRRVSRTIADLDGSARVSDGHLAEALQYRGVSL